MMLASPSTQRGHKIDIHSLAGTHAFDLKLDGIRARLWWDGRGDGEFELTNRNGLDIAPRFPEIEQRARAVLGAQALLLDGEVVSEDRLFSTIAKRNSTNHPRVGDIARHPCRFFAFDLLKHSTMAEPDIVSSPSDMADLRGVSWTRRRKELDARAELLGAAGVSVTPVWDDPDCLTTVLETGWEGVIAKRKGSPYREGKRSPDWIKFKGLHTVSCLPFGYDESKSRTIRAIEVALLDDAGKPVKVGRVGTGFDEAEARRLRDKIDAHETFVVDVNCLNVSAKRVLRSPVYKGIRTDVDPLACTTEQLNAIPLY